MAEENPIAEDSRCCKTLSQGKKNGAYKRLHKLDVILRILLENHFHFIKKKKKKKKKTACLLLSLVVCIISM